MDHRTSVMSMNSNYDEDEDTMNILGGLNNNQKNYGNLVLLS